MSEANEPRELTRDENYERVFALFRKYITHEDQLINHRTTWLITMQSFLWATFGFSYQVKFGLFVKLTEAKIDPALVSAASDQYNGFLLVLAIVGFFTAVVCYLSVNAATNAIDALRQKWDASPYKRSSNAYLPEITGGGHYTAPWFGTVVSKALPVLLSFLWFLTIAVILSSKKWSLMWSY